MPVNYIEVDEETQDQRVDNFLIVRLPGIPKSRIYRAIRKGEVRVNRGRVDAKTRLCLGDQVRIPPLNVPASRPLPAASGRLERLLEEAILYEDQRVIVIDKPAGVSVQRSGTERGVKEILQGMRGEDVYIELVHRLDKGTSGCLVLAKKRSYLRQLHALLRSRSVTKQYFALVKGDWAGGECVVRAPLLKNVLQSGERMVRVDKLSGKPSVSRFTPLRRFGQATLVLVHIETGRTHQIRVHAAHLGCPVAGDEKYGDREFNKAMRARGLDRMFLHAASIAFADPEHPAWLGIGVGLSASLQQVLRVLG